MHLCDEFDEFDSFKHKSLEPSFFSRVFRSIISFQDMDVVYISKAGGVYHTNPRCGGGSWSMEACRRDDPRLLERRECQRCNMNHRPHPRSRTHTHRYSSSSRGSWGAKRGGRSGVDRKRTEEDHEDESVDMRVKTLNTEFKQIRLHTLDKIIQMIIPGSGLETLLRVIAVNVCVIQPHTRSFVDDGKEERKSDDDDDDDDDREGEEMDCVCVEADELVEDMSLLDGDVGTVKIELQKNIGTTAITANRGKEVHFPLRERDSFFSNNAFFVKGKVGMKFGLVEGRFAMFVFENERNGKPLPVLERELDGFLKKLQRLKKLPTLKSH
jgi:hypothetical protein